METKREIKYAIVDNNGKYLIETTLHGNEDVVYVRTKEKCKEIIEMYYRDKGYTIKKIV